MKFRFLMTSCLLAFNIMTVIAPDSAQAANRTNRLWQRPGVRPSIKSACKNSSRQAPSSPRRRPKSPLNPEFQLSDRQGSGVYQRSGRERIHTACGSPRRNLLARLHKESERAADAEMRTAALRRLCPLLSEPAGGSGSGRAGIFGLTIDPDAERLDADLPPAEESENDFPDDLSIQTIWNAVSRSTEPVTLGGLLEHGSIKENDVQAARIFLNFFVARGQMTCSDNDEIRAWKLKSDGEADASEPADIEKYRRILDNFENLGVIENPDEDDLPEYAWEVATFSFESDDPS